MIAAKVLDTATQYNVSFQVAKTMGSPAKIPTYTINNPVTYRADLNVDKVIESLRNQVDSFQFQINVLREKIRPVLFLVKEVVSSTDKDWVVCP